MNQILVAIFDSDPEARAAQQELQQGGFRGSHVYVPDDPADARTHAERVHDAVDRSNSVRAVVDNIVHALFDRFGGHLPGDRLYEEAARRGHVVLMLESHDARQIEAARRIVERHGAKDVALRET